MKANDIFECYCGGEITKRQDGYWKCCRCSWTSMMAYPTKDNEPEKIDEAEK